MREYRRPEVYPPLPDIFTEGEECGAHVNAHPDGRPWRKACDECALRRCNPQNYADGDLAAIRSGDDGRTFYCLHRMSQGKERICASWAAVQAGKARAALVALQTEGESQ